MSLRERRRVADFWDGVIAQWLEGGDPMPDPLPFWFQSYRGRGIGQVTREAFAEPWIGPILGQPSLVVLGLNPGRAYLDFQKRSGLFAQEIRELGGFTRWAATAPYSRPPWTSKIGPNQYHDRRVEFARRFYADEAIDAKRVLAVELYPWHSTKWSGKFYPPRDVLNTMVWAPLEELDIDEVFAFGRTWERVAEALGLRLEEHLGEGGKPMGSHVASRRVLTYRMPSGRQRLVVSSQGGYAGPPDACDTRRLREILLAR